MMKVIWPIDPYQSAAPQLDIEARSLSVWLGASGKITILPVFVLTPAVRPVPVRYFKDILPDLEREAMRRLARLHAHWSDLPISPPNLLVLPSDHVENVAEALVDFARKEAADLLVLRTYGRKGFSRLVRGSLSETLAKRAELPVLILPSAWASGQPRFSAPGFFPVARIPKPGRAAAAA